MCTIFINDVLKSTFGWMPARIALALMAWLGFINLYMTRINVSVIIVAMVKRNPSNTALAPCLITEGSNQTNVSSSYGGTQSPTTTEDVDVNDEEAVLDWNETIQGVVLGSFFYGYIVTQIPGGRLAELYGAKWVFGGCILGGGICALLSPLAARWHYGAFIFLRVVHGLFQGVSWPSMHACLAQWIPPLERPRFIGAVYFGTNLSTALTLPLCGFIIQRHGWPTAFYVTGSISLVWCFFWFTLVHSYPSQHPRICPKELEYIESATKKSGTSGEDDQPDSIPWRAIFTSVPNRALMIADFGNNWAIGLFYTQLPTYMKNILGFSIKENGLISALPFIARYFGAIVMSTLGDWLLSRKYISIRTCRRIFSTIAMWLPAAMLLGVTFSGCDWKVIVALFCAGLFFNGAVATSTIVNPTDIAPNLAGTLFGLTNTTSTIASFVVPVLTGVMTDGQQAIGQWQKVFWICVPMYLVTHVIFFIFCSGDVQLWNYSSHKNMRKDEYANENLHEREAISLTTETISP